jgi:itaconate CoA-transferase
LRNRDALRALIEDVFAVLPSDKVIARLEAAQIAYARMNSVQEFVEHPQLSARGRWMEIGSEAGRLRALPPPASMDALAPVMGDVPALGQHTAAILAELGFAADAVAGWKKEAVI